MSLNLHFLVPVPVGAEFEVCPSICHLAPSFLFIDPTSGFPTRLNLVFNRESELVANKMSLVHYHDSESEDDESVPTPVDKMPPGVGEYLSVATQFIVGFLRYIAQYRDS